MVLTIPMDHPGYDTLIFSQVRTHHANQVEQDVGIYSPLKKTVQVSGSFMQGFQEFDIFEGQYESREAHAKKQSVEYQVSAFDEQIMISFPDGIFIQRMKIQGLTDAYRNFLIFFL